MKMVELPDERGHFGQYGGVFVAETLVHALDELRRAYERCRKDPEFIAEFEHGSSSPSSSTSSSTTSAGRPLFTTPGGCRIGSAERRST